MPRLKIKLGQLLIKEGLITEAQLNEALRIQKKKGGRIGQVIIDLKMAREVDIISVLSKQLNIPFFTKDKGLLKPAEDQALEKLVPEDFARQHKVLPLKRTMNSLTIAFLDPLDLIVIDNLKKITKCEINPVIATKDELEAAISEFYGSLDLLQRAIGASYETVELKLEEVELEKEELTIDKLIHKAEEAPVIKLVNLLLMQAIKDGASDIHIEPFEKKFSIRYRVDGILYDIPAPAWHMYLPIISRIKILSKLDIAEKRLPQDGGFHLRVEDRLIDIRTSSMPTVFSEKVVMRILDKSTAPLVIEKLGFEGETLKAFEDAISKPYGLVFLTGPTGSGKTTTLYAALNYIKSPKKNIITIEDPVEYRIEGINQVEVKPAIGLTFASGLRSTLRQDPDIVLVGEVRDLETAEICVRAALTGHLVLSTLHTNDASSAITRLIDIGIEPFLVVSSLLLVASQRLVRKLCPTCKEAYKVSPELRQKADLPSNVKELFRAKGCDSCRHTGYKGRMGIFEVLSIDDKMRELISNNASGKEIEKAAKQAGMKTLWDSGVAKAQQGLTSLEEIYTVTYKTE
jgi:type IV pilus assembly protein PilB